MDNMEEKLGAILNNPGMMQQIMAMAQSLSGPQENAKPEPPPTSSPADSGFQPEIDPAMLQKIIGMAGQTGIDAHQKALILALRPYLTQQHIEKLEKAMRAAKLANLASGLIGSGALSFLTGR